MVDWTKNTEKINFPLSQVKSPFVANGDIIIITTSTWDKYKITNFINTLMICCLFTIASIIKPRIDGLEFVIEKL